MNGEEPPAVHHVGIGAGAEQALGHVNEPAEGRLVKNRVLVLLQKDGMNKNRS
jgi:hypothetical protein